MAGKPMGLSVGKIEKVVHLKTSRGGDDVSLA